MPPQWRAATVLLLGLVLTAAIYLPGLTGALHFDDYPNLRTLGHIENTRSALGFVLGGNAGPTGRPLALLTFVPQAYAWPSSPRTFLQTNIGLHVLNGALVAWLLFLLSHAAGHERGRAALIGAVAATLWMLLPIHASSSLVVIQRMTTLSAALLLLGFIGYLYCRSAIERRPVAALAGMSACLIAGTGFSTLAKENGALLPLLVLVAESTLLSRPNGRLGPMAWQAWQGLFLALPAFALLTYLAHRYSYPEYVLLTRGYTADERLLTQAHVLWQYLINAFLPTPPALGPFHDGQVVHREWLHPRSLLAVGGWLTVAAMAMFVRRRAPLFAFAVGWFLAGHALESTTVPLELYFEHRNYVPLIGPVFALVAAVLAIPAQWQGVVRLALAAYGIVLAGILFSVTTLWGRPDLAAEMWYIHNPDSNRAVQYVSERLQIDRDQSGARKVLMQYAATHPDKFGVRIQAILLSCVLRHTEPPPELLEELDAGLPTAAYEAGVVRALERLYDLTSRGRCSGLDTQRVYELASALADNKAFRAHAFDGHNLHILMAREGLARRDLGLTMHHLEAALARNYAMPTLQGIVYLLTSAGLTEEAERFVVEAKARKPGHPMRALTWAHQVAELDTAMRNHRLAASHHEAGTINMQRPSASVDSR